MGGGGEVEVAPFERRQSAGATPPVHSPTSGSLGGDFACGARRNNLVAPEWLGPGNCSSTGTAGWRPAQKLF